MRVGVYGGSFDPVHWGHLMLAECCREALQLDEVWFVPAFTPPHKQDRGLSPPHHRQQMLLLATLGNPSFRVCSLELDRQGTSYTVETLAEIRTLLPSAELFLLMGADTWRDLPNWRQPSRVCQLAAPVVVHRGGTAPVDSLTLQLPDASNQPASVVARQVQMPQIELSSTELRQRARDGLSLRYRLTPAVEQYIAQHALYRV